MLKHRSKAVLRVIIDQIYSTYAVIMRLAGLFRADIVARQVTRWQTGRTYLSAEASQEQHAAAVPMTGMCAHSEPLPMQAREGEQLLHGWADQEV